MYIAYTINIPAHFGKHYRRAVNSLLNIKTWKRKRMSRLTKRDFTKDRISAHVGLGTSHFLRRFNGRLYQ